MSNSVQAENLQALEMLRARSRGALPNTKRQQPRFRILDGGEKTTPRNLVGILREGYIIQQGDQHTKGPAEIGLTPEVAIDNIVKWDNVGDVKQWLREWYGLPFERQARRFTPKEEFDMALKTARSINAGRAAEAAGMSREDLAVLGREIGSSVAAALAPVLAKSIVEALTEEDASAPAGPRAVAGRGSKAARRK